MLHHGLLNTYGHPTPKPRENSGWAEIHFKITEEREMDFTSGFFCLKVLLSGFTLMCELEYKLWMWVVKTGNFRK